jgi:hypothetical protein
MSDQMMKTIDDAIAEIFRLRAAIAKAQRDVLDMTKALRPFASVAKHDIGADETNDDFFRPMDKNNRAERLRVGHFRKAFNTLGDDDAL